VKTAFFIHKVGMPFKEGEVVRFGYWMREGETTNSDLNVCYLLERNA
jgi:hypothetical protein